MASTDTLSDILWRYFRYMKFGFMLVGLWTGLYFFNHCSCRKIPRQNQQMEPNYKAEVLTRVDPTIHSQDSGLKFGDPIAYRVRRGNENPEEVMYMGRVVAFSGQRIRIEQGEILINGAKQSEAEYLSKKDKLEFEMEEMLVPRGHVFVLVDNRALYETFRHQPKARDSRHAGPILERAIIGKISSESVALKK